MEAGKLGVNYAKLLLGLVAPVIFFCIAKRDKICVRILAVNLTLPYNAHSFCSQNL